MRGVAGGHAGTAELIFALFIRDLRVTIEFGTHWNMQQQQAKVIISSGKIERAHGVQRPPTKVERVLFQPLQRGFSVGITHAVTTVDKGDGFDSLCDFGNYQTNHPHNKSDSSVSFSFPAARRAYIDNEEEP